MSLQNRQAQEIAQLPRSGKDAYVSATYTSKSYERHVDVSTTAAGSAFTLTLGQPLPEAGQTKMVYMSARNGSKDVTVSGEGFSDITLDAAAEFTLLYSTGKQWVEIGSNHA